MTKVKYKLYRKIITSEERLKYDISKDSSHLISIETYIDEDKWTSKIIDTSTGFLRKNIKLLLKGIIKESLIYYKS